MAISQVEQPYAQDVFINYYQARGGGSAEDPWLPDAALCGCRGCHHEDMSDMLIKCAGVTKLEGRTSMLNKECRFRELLRG